MVHFSTWKKINFFWLKFAAENLKLQKKYTPSIMCSPDSSTFVVTNGYVLLIQRALQAFLVILTV